jgi:Kyakuja-Dileera-Zisupton transposase
MTLTANKHIDTFIATTFDTLDTSPPQSDTDDRPSHYLRTRCPLCFGGQNWKRDRAEDIMSVYVPTFPFILLILAPLYCLISSPDVIVCIDACFTQKRARKQHCSNQPDPVNPIESVFLTDIEIKAMEADVEERRPQRGRKRTQPNIDNEEDGYEPGMRIPISVLNGCGESFLAADEKREKASTQFFADTGLMALLCRHDRVLWLANMTSAGEKQHYALALIQKLFDNIPLDMRIGLLYDIGCQLEQSCRKWGFLAGILARITFAISVFHAFGHQWPCQIIYHPRKCVGFGLTDGEGCERLWSAIRPLIPSLRVSGVSHSFLLQYIIINIVYLVSSTSFCFGYTSAASGQEITYRVRQLA